MDLCGFVSTDTVTVGVWGLGINDYKNKATNFIISPNPSNGFVTINVNKAGSYQIFVRDLLGKTVGTSFTQQGLSFQNNTPLNSGVYIIELANTNTNEKYIKKLVVQ